MHNHAATNAQFCDFVQENVALDQSLEHGIAWFNEIENLDNFYF